ncbi:MAG: addiction module protein [Bacteroidetes bacterium]|nr:addiction module protein [Bacteroidota bacterium]
MSIKEILAEMLSLPTEQRALAADALLKSLNPINEEINNQWLNVAKSRLQELRLSDSQNIKGNEVFTEIWKKYSK